MLRVGYRPGHLDRDPSHLAEVGATRRKLQPALLEASRLDHLLDQCVHLISLGGEHREGALGALRDLSERAPLQHRKVATDDRDGPAQLMGGEVEEFRLGPFQGRDPLGQGRPVEPDREVGRVGGEAADLVGAEEGREGPGEHHQDAGAAVEGERDDQGRLCILAARQPQHRLPGRRAELCAQPLGLDLVDAARGQHGPVAVGDEGGIGADEAHRPLQGPFGQALTGGAEEEKILDALAVGHLLRVPPGEAQPERRREAHIEQGRGQQGDELGGQPDERVLRGGGRETREEHDQDQGGVADGEGSEPLPKNRRPAD